MAACVGLVPTYFFKLLGNLALMTELHKRQASDARFTFLSRVLQKILYCLGKYTVFEKNIWTFM